MSRKRLVLLLTTVALCASFLFPLGSAAGGGCHPIMDGVVTAERVTDPKNYTATIAECGFYPDVLYVEPGSEITWFNKDPVPHSVTGTHLSWGSEKLLQMEDTISFTFDEEGVFPYYCLLHPGMAGVVVVGDPDPKDIAVGLTSTTGGGDTDPGGVATEADAQPMATKAEPASQSSVGTLAVALVFATVALAGGVMVFRRRRHSDEVIGEAQAV